MAFEFRKISDVGTCHPVVARLGVQAGELVKWLRIEEPVKQAIAELYAITLRERLIRCHAFRDRLERSMEDAVKNVSERNDGRARDVPHVIDLNGMAEGFLYETKNYLRDLLGLFQILYGCTLKDASVFADRMGGG
jgi:hypothetical protein